ncbi:hypothetical protein SDC9_57359 [bioreactor metagenome]|jgi:hypothetical protein|uniref:Uncharacterized protein n=1 Tax=bioreactor metagenome TaxID=1076179 RepID=A0A644X589_9ZZZZ|nr:hypothetical protein [Clostridia bacterium]
MQYITEAEIDNISSDTGKALAAEPKVTIVIHPESGEPYWEGGVNGHFFRIRTNESVAVPQSLATLIAQSAAVKVEIEARTRAFRKSGGKKVS